MTWSLAVPTPETATAVESQHQGWQPVDPQCAISTSQEEEELNIPLRTPEDPMVCISFPHADHHLGVSLFNSTHAKRKN